MWERELRRDSLGEEASASMMKWCTVFCRSKIWESWAAIFSFLSLLTQRHQYIQPLQQLHVEPERILLIHFPTLSIRELIQPTEAQFRLAGVTPHPSQLSDHSPGTRSQTR